MDEENLENVPQDTADDMTVEGQLEALAGQVAETKEQLLRRTAELENMRRRHQQEREQWTLESNRALLLVLLPTLDDLERTLEHAANPDDAMTQGVELVYKNFLKALERFGVRAMEVVGAEFDPQRHDALMQEVRDDVEPGVITQEVQRGYLLGDKVLRHAKVIVARSGEGE